MPNEAACTHVEEIGPPLPFNLQLPRLRRADACEYLQRRHGITRSPATLAKYATTGGGPRYQKFGRDALYDPHDLDDWATTLLSAPAAHTSEHSRSGSSR